MVNPDNKEILSWSVWGDEKAQTRRGTKSWTVWSMCRHRVCSFTCIAGYFSRVMTNRDISLVVSRWAPWPLSLELQPLFPSPEWRQCTIGWITQNVLFVPASYLLREECGSMDVWILIPLLSDASQHFLRVICLSYFPGGLSDALCIFSIKNVKFLLHFTWSFMH